MYDPPTPPSEVKIALDAFGAVVAYRWALVRGRAKDWALVRDWRQTERCAEWPAQFSDAGGSTSHPSSLASLQTQYINAVSILKGETDELEQLVVWLFAVKALHHEVTVDYEQIEDGVWLPFTTETGVTTVAGYVDRRWPHMAGDVRAGNVARLAHRLTEFYDISKRELGIAASAPPAAEQSTVASPPQEPDPPYNSPSAKEIRQARDTSKAG
ncbi:MAG: hypothetical protein IH945_04430 [Armatimonadetes bacterium]|nr:hypothetical protein [Armatimonadota bacterium]